MKKSAMTACVACVLGVSPAMADLVRVEVTGPVGFNAFSSGALAGIPAGAASRMSFEVDSNVFLNSATFPTRAYSIVPSSFNLQVGSVSVPFVNPYPAGQTPRFVLRNNDPAVDGFFLSAGTDLPTGLPIEIGLANSTIEFSRGFNNGLPLSSLNILDAVGTYGQENLSSFNFSVNRFGNPFLEIEFQSITISVVPTPGSLAVVGLAGVLVARRRRGV